MKKVLALSIMLIANTSWSKPIQPVLVEKECSDRKNCEIVDRIPDYYDFSKPIIYANGHDKAESKKR